MDFPGGSDSKESACNAGNRGSIPEWGRSPGGGNGNSSILPWRIPWTVSYSPWGRKEWDMTEWLTLYFAVKLQYFGHLIQRTDSLEQTQVLGKIKGRRKGGQQKMKWLDDITRWWWTWVWASSGRVDREAWCAAVHAVAKNRMRLSDWTELKTERALEETDQLILPEFFL